MQRWNSKREMMGDDPPYLAVGTEVSAKYKGAFCEAKVRKIVRSVKCKVAYKQGLGTATVTDDQIKGTLRAGATVEVRHSEKKEYVEAVITKIQDCSQYTVVFDDGDITTLRRTALCLKSGRHFAESETLDQLPLTHPEHFGNPVIGGRRGRRNRQDDSSDEEEPVRKGKRHKEEKEVDIGKVVCVEVSEKKKQKDNWFPGLVVAPTAQDTVRIHVREDYLVRSFKDGRYYTVPKKEATAFTREIGLKVDNNTLRIAVEKALQFLDKDELPPHWDRELLFGLDESSGSDSDAPFDSDTSDDEPREEKDHFVAQLYKFMDDRGTPINKGPIICARDVDLYKLFKVVHKLGGYNRVTNHNQWKTVSHKLGFGQNGPTVNLVKHAYKKFLHSFEDFYRKLGCTMVNHPRGQRSRHRSNRSLIRDKDKAIPQVKDKAPEKESEDTKEVIAVEIKKEDITKDEEKKIKEIVVDTSKVIKDLRKDIQKTKSVKEEKVEKRDDRVVATTSKNIESIPVKIKEEKVKLDDREERIKMRELSKIDSGKEEVKQDLQVKNGKTDDGQKNIKITRREIRETKKDDNDAKIKKVVTSVVTNPLPTEIESKSSSDTTNNEPSKKSRSLLSRITGSKKPKTLAEKLPKVSNKQIGINAVRQKRTLSERMKAIVKKFKLKKSVKAEVKSSLDLSVPPDINPSSEASEEDRKKKILFSEEEKKKKAVLDEEKKKKLTHTSEKDEEKKKKCVSSGDEEKKKKSEDNEKVMPQLTRSKSKEEGLCVGKTRKAEIVQENKLDKKSSASQSNVPNTVCDSDKKRGRKRKDTEKEDKSNGSDEILDLLPSYKTVSVGDKLKVYYGPTHESKVTYEAKVLNQKEESNEIMYLVHYTGWNTRYDEWIKRSRIADNLSWNPSRAKKVRPPQQSTSRSGPKRGRRSESGGGGARSTTPSSVTSSSSRTKSPAVSHSKLRNTRTRTRTRRISGHTDLSELSESDEDYNSESENESIVQLKQRNRLGSEIGDDDDIRKTDSDDISKDDYDTKPNIEIVDERLKGISSSDEKDTKEEVNQDSVVSRMRSRNYRRKCDEAKLEPSIIKEEIIEATDDSNEITTVSGIRGKKVKEDFEDVAQDRTRSRSEKRKAEEVNKLPPINLDEIKKEISLEESIKIDRLRSRSEKRKLSDIKPEFEDEKEEHTKAFEEDKDSSNIIKSIENEEDTSDTISDNKNKLWSKVDENTKLVAVFKDENEDESQLKERRRSRRVTPRKDDVVKYGGKDYEDQPKGRDFDLNQIRSELKGIDKAVKLPVDVTEHSNKEPDVENKICSNIDFKNKEDNDNSIKIISATADDIYEFKEPEPFEFEVRNKCSEEKGLKQLRTFGRINDISMSKSPVRRKVIKTKSENLTNNTIETKRKYQRSVKKDGVETEEEDREEPHISNLKLSNLNDTDSSSEQSIKVVKEPCEEAFDKLVETPSFREVLTSVKEEDILQPLFVDLPGESDRVSIDEDSEGRLVISETETETELEGPLFSHQQRDHEDLFPSLISQQLSSNDSTKNPSSIFSAFPNITDVNCEKEKHDEEEDYEAPKQSQPATDEDSNDLLILQHSSNKDEVKSKIFGLDTESEISQENVEDDCDEEEKKHNSQVENSSNPLKIEEDEKVNSNVVESIILNDSVECEKLAINESNVTEYEDDNDDLETLIDQNDDSDKVEESGSKEEDDEDDVIEIDTIKDDLEETVIEAVEECSQQSDKRGDMEEETVVSEEMEISNDKTVILETGVIEDEVVMEEVKEELIVEEEVEEQPVELNEEDEEEEITTEAKKGEKEVFEDEIVEIKEEKLPKEETDENLQSLLCEETIPGSPAPATCSQVETEHTGSGIVCAELPFASAPGSSVPHYKPPPPLPPPQLPPPPQPAMPIVINEAAPVMDNTPPTTPESSLSPISNSPREERSGSSPVPDNDSSKSHRDSSEVDMDMYQEVTKIGHYSEEDTVCVNTRIKKLSPSNDDGDSQSSKKRRRSHRRSEDSNKRPKLAQRSPRHQAGSESDDTSENSLDLLSTHSRSPRPSKYNFYVQLDPELDGSQRIAVLQQKLAELRKTYMSVKTELACIDRRRKKLRRRERDEKIVKPEVSCS